MGLTNSEVCLEMPDGTAICDETLHKNPHSYTSEQWAPMRPGRFSVTTDWYANNKAALEKLCHQTRACVEKVMARLQAQAERMIEEFRTANEPL